MASLIPQTLYNLGLAKVIMISLVDELYVIAEVECYRMIIPALSMCSTSVLKFRGMCYSQWMLKWDVDRTCFGPGVVM